jgi:hypothetical protein
MYQMPPGRKGRSPSSLAASCPWVPKLSGSLLLPLAVATWPTDGWCTDSVADGEQDRWIEALDRLEQLAR